MAKRTDFDRDSELIEEVEALRDVFEIEESHPPRVRVALCRNINLNYTGVVTGTLYKFYGAGSTLDVFPEDVPAMLEKTVGKRSCCGSPPGKYFVLVEG